ncbi:precorrin-2 dehydrogenase/sirohydrochlorin ferrochelatase family protein [Thermodesulfitimonas autotrophica]|uniref:precorrin-2 dehydrogenase/sirohydrochlorin ferrochelatase family protein n=1 Tax=Thermodesulfitimonas autotrophica TaxID=1894989 RepID=UPI002FE396F9
MLYPAFIKLENRQCLVVGGGKVAARKVKMLLMCGAKVRVVSPQVVEELAALAAAGEIEWVQRGFVAGDTAGAFLVVSATDDREVNSQVARECAAGNILLNVVDQPEFCSFYVPSVIRRGELTVAISTGGKSPLLARKLREKLEKVFPPAYGEFLEYLGSLRREIISRYPAAKEEVLDKLVTPEVFRALEKNDVTAAKELVKGVYDRYWSEPPDGAS